MKTIEIFKMLKNTCICSEEELNIIDESIKEIEELQYKLTIAQTYIVELEDRLRVKKTHKPKYLKPISDECMFDNGI